MVRDRTGRLLAEVDGVRQSALPLVGEADLDPLVERTRGARLVLLGEASHGTHEFFWWRAALTRRLVAEGRCSFIAMEADHADCLPLDKWTRLAHGPHEASSSIRPASPAAILARHRQWPSWPLANAEIVELCQSLRDHNAERAAADRTTLCGLEAYPLWGAIRSALGYGRERGGGGAAGSAAAAYFQGEPWVPERYLDAVAEDLAGAYRPLLGDDASLLPAAPDYFRKLLTGGSAGWEARERLWAEWLDRLLARHGPGVVWAHNSHIGDARAASPSRDRATGPLSLGELARERYGADNVALVGFTGGEGEVMAAREPGGAMETLPVPAPRPGSLDELLAASMASPALFLFGPGTASWATVERQERAIGLVYDPARHDVPYLDGQPARRYDALCWFPTTSPVRALHHSAAQHGDLPGI